MRGTLIGERLKKRFLEAAEVRILTVDLAMAEISAKLAREGLADETRPALNAIEVSSEILPISRAAAEAAGPLLVELRKQDRGASLADALMLASAREQGAKLVSGDPCFVGQRDVIRS